MEFHFTLLDWGVVALYLGFTTWLGHRMRGHQATVHDFFLGGRTLPWQAVSGSIIATEISGVTFLAVPSIVFAAGGNFTYLQWAIGSIIARVLVGVFFVKAFYEESIFSPYDYMGKKLGVGIKRLATFLFWLGGILGQSVRVLIAALALEVVSPLSFEMCIVAIGSFSVLWTWMGGMRTVIWTDVIQFFLFVFGGLLALFWIVFSLDGGWAAYFEIGAESDKFQLWNLSDDFSQRAGFTLWLGILAMPFQNLSAFGVDQLNAQRMFCCRNAHEARKAIIFSSVGQLVTILMLAVGVGLFVYEAQVGFTQNLREAISQDGDVVFPGWIVTYLPAGLRGLILAGVFAAAISSLDSILAALSQTTLSLFRHPAETEADGKDSVLLSRIFVAVWGAILTLFAIVLDNLRGNIDMVNLAFAMISYTSGPMLGLFLAALRRRGANPWGLVVGVLLSLVMVLLVRTDLYTILLRTGWEPALFEGWPFVDLVEENGEWSVVGKIHYAWMYPVTCLLTYGCGLLGSGNNNRGAQ